MESIITTSISVVGALAGAVFGAVLTHNFEKRNRKVRLCFSLQPTGRNDETEFAMKVKENPSGYIIKV